MAASHLELLVEEPSMEAFLRELLPRILPDSTSFEVHSFQGKSDLLSKLADRLRGYAKWLPSDWRLLVVVDRDDENCTVLKRQLEGAAKTAGLITLSQSSSKSWQLVNRIAIEELEAWYFGDWQAVRTSFPRVSANVPQTQAFRDPDGIVGGTWEAFERVMQQHGYFRAGLPKIEAARTVGRHVVPERSKSASFRVFYAAVMAAVS